MLPGYQITSVTSINHHREFEPPQHAVKLELLEELELELLLELLDDELLLEELLELELLELLELGLLELELLDDEQPSQVL